MLIWNYWIVYVFGYLCFGFVLFIGIVFCILFVGFVMCSFLWDRYVVLDECILVVSVDGEENLYKNLCGSGIILFLIVYCFVFKK